MTEWTRFTGTQAASTTNGSPSIHLPPPPPWRRFDRQQRGKSMRPPPHAVEMVNIALYLRRPLLITGKPGTGKSSLAYAVALELGLGDLLRWPINTRSTLQEGLYRYDALGRLRDSQAHPPQLDTAQAIAHDIAKYIRLGPLGTAFVPNQQPRVLLIDEIDKSDIDLPNDLLNVFEEGDFTIPELAPQRLSLHADRSEVISVAVTSLDEKPVLITNGQVQCQEFPIVIMTSNGERDFPPAFLRRCLRLHLDPPDSTELAEIVRAHVGDDVFAAFEQRLVQEIDLFVTQRDGKNDDMATDQLLNIVYLLTQDIKLTPAAKQSVLQKLNAGA